MTETLFGILAIILCIIGSVSIIKWCALRLASSGCKNRIYAVLLKEQPDIEVQMLIDTVEWDDALKDAQIFAVDGGLDDEMVYYCESVLGESRIKFVPFNEAEEFIKFFK